MKRNNLIHYQQKPFVLSVVAFPGSRIGLDPCVAFNSLCRRCCPHTLFLLGFFFFFLSVVAFQLDHRQQKSTEWLGKLFLVPLCYVITNNLHIAL